MLIVLTLHGIPAVQPNSHATLKGTPVQNNDIPGPGAEPSTILTPCSRIAAPFPKSRRRFNLYLCRHIAP
jgi:hypothetical protein